MSDDASTHYSNKPPCSSAAASVHPLAGSTPSCVSLGGYASFSIFANVPHAQAAGLMIGVSSFARHWTDLLDECAFSGPEWAAAFDRVAEHMREYASNPKKLKLNIYPAGHTVTPQMERDAVEWFATHLL